MSSGLRLTDEIVSDRILNKCKEKNVEFIKFDNTENKYKNNNTYLVLKCNKCGNIWNTTTYGKFVNVGHSCPNCSHTKPLTKEDIILKIKNVCEEKDFTFIGFNGEYSGIKSKLILKCNKCGKVWGTTSYLNFIKKDRKSHSCGRNNPISMPHKYNKSKAVKNINDALIGTSLKFVSFDEKGYIGNKNTHVILKCKKCGEVNSYRYSYLLCNKIICKNCEKFGKFTHEHATNLVKEKCKLLDYTFIGFDTKDGKYKNKKCYLILRCNKCNVIWKTTTFASFMSTIIKCPGCTNSWKMEKEIEVALRKNNIEFIPQCRRKNLPWLIHKISLSLDFYLPKHNIAIECQGREHFEPVDDYGGENAYKESIIRDKKKLLLCKKHGVKLLYYDSELNHTEFLGEEVYNNEDNLLKKITSYE